MRDVLMTAAAYAARADDVRQKALQRFARSAAHLARIKEQLQLSVTGLERSRSQLDSAEAALEATVNRPPAKDPVGAGPMSRLAQARDSDPVAAGRMVAPQIATLIARPPSGTDWIHEINFDGYRLQGLRDGQRVWLLDVNGRDWSDRFPSLVAAMRALTAERVSIDCVAVACDDSGASNVSRLEETMAYADDARIVLHAFDLLQLEGRDTRVLPLVERKKMLRRVLKADDARIPYAPHVCQSGRRALEQARLLGIQGIVSKRRDAPYQSGLSLDWRESGRVRCS